MDPKNRDPFNKLAKQYNKEKGANANENHLGYAFRHAFPGSKKLQPVGYKCRPRSKPKKRTFTQVPLFSPERSRVRQDIDALNDKMERVLKVVRYFLTDEERDLFGI